MRTMHYDVMKPFLLQFHLTIFIVIYYYRQYSHLLFISNIVYDTEFFGFCQLPRLINRRLAGK